MAEMVTVFEGTLVKWGSSIGIAIPKPIRDGLQLERGQKVRIIAKDNSFCIEKIESKKKA